MNYTEKKTGVETIFTQLQRVAHWINMTFWSRKNFIYNLFTVYTKPLPSAIISQSHAQVAINQSSDVCMHKNMRLSILYLRLTPYCLCARVCVWRGCKDVKHSACRFPRDWPDSAENTAAALSVAINHIATRQTHFHHDVCRESPIPVNQVITHRPLSQPQLLRSTLRRNALIFFFYL